MHNLTWEENGETVTRPWVTESNFSHPKKISIADDTLKADHFYQAASEGAAFVWKGDFQNAKQLLQAVQRRIDKQSDKKKTAASLTPADYFHKYRQSQAHRAQLLSRLLICVESNLKINLNRSPEIHDALTEANPVSGEFVISLRELLGIIGAHEWRKKGVSVPALDDKIYPHYGIFSPVRGEYLELVANAPLPANIACAFDVGTGTGVIAAILAKRGVQKIIGTDLDERAITCATENILRLGFDRQVDIVKANLFPQGTADLVVCNPPWLPARPTSRIERAVYDENSKMLKDFLGGVCKHVSEDGEAWLILSDLAEHLGLRKKNDVSSWIDQANLSVIDQMEIRPKHPKSNDVDNPLYQARSQEVTRLWRLKPKLTE